MHLSLIDEEVNTELTKTIRERMLTDQSVNFRSDALFFDFNIDTLVLLADDLIDTLYVVNSMLNKLGIPTEAVYAEVHRSNMEKAITCNHTIIEIRGSEQIHESYALSDCPKCKGTGSAIVRRADGKILKPDGWMPPDIKSIILETLEKQRSVGRELNRQQHEADSDITGTT